MRHSALTGLAAVLMLGVLTGCAAASGETGVDESLDVYGAKEIAQEMERELAGYVPATSVASNEQLEEGILLSCGGDGIFQWSGHNYLTLTGELDSEPVVDAVAEDFSERETFTTKRDTTDDGVPRVHVRGPSDSSYSLALSVDRTQVEIFSFSPCFRLAENLSPRAKY